MVFALHSKLTLYIAIATIASFILLTLNHSLELVDAKKSDDSLPSEKQIKCFDKIAEKYAPESPPRDEIDRCYQY